MPTPTTSVSENEGYPLPAFYFKVVFARFPIDADSSFQQVKGIGTEMETEDVIEGGENRFVHRLPKAVKHSPLELRRGIAKSDSPLVQWCREVLEGGLSSLIQPSLITVYLYNGSGDPARAWTFANAYPVKWSIDDFNSTKNQVAIESIVFSYSYSNRIL